MSIIPSLYGSHYTSQEVILLINLGSPQSPKVSDVQTFLDEFLMDEHIINIKYFWRALLVKGIIIPLRKKRSAQNYSMIWDKEKKCFPLPSQTSKLAQNLSELIKKPVALAMRYGQPTMDQALQQIKELSPKKVTVLPLYPQYTSSSFETALVHCQKRNEALQLNLNLELKGAFYNHKIYRVCLANSVRPYLAQDFDKLVISMHGIPLSHLEESCRRNNGLRGHCMTHQHNDEHANECYRLQCEETVNFLQEDLNLKDEQIELSYQSRVGRHEWIKPYTINRIAELPHEGIKKILIVSPGFICDCLETLQEINIAYRNLFFENGGESFTYIPCLNSSPAFVSSLSEILK